MLRSFQFSVPARFVCPKQFPEIHKISQSSHNFQAMKVALWQYSTTKLHVSPSQTLFISPATGRFPRVTLWSYTFQSSGESHSMSTNGQLRFYSSLKGLPHHSSFCFLAANESIHATRQTFSFSESTKYRDVTSRHLEISVAGLLSTEPLLRAVTLRTGHSTSYQANLNSGSLILTNLAFARLEGLNGERNMATSLTEASVYASTIAQKFQLFHDRHAAWLLFGLCVCLSAGAGSIVPHFVSGSPPALAEALARRAGFPSGSSSTRFGDTPASHGKQVYTDYSVTGVPGDGRCLFRAVAHSSSLRAGRPAPDESAQRRRADDLRSKALDELVRQREDTEWFIEGDFDSYVMRMREPHTWGGEPELLMLSHVLQAPITVFMEERGGIIAIAEYGQEYDTQNPIRVLYHGFGHYEAVQLNEVKPISKL